MYRIRLNTYGLHKIRDTAMTERVLGFIFGIVCLLAFSTGAIAQSSDARIVELERQVHQLQQRVDALTQTAHTGTVRPASW